MTPKARLLASKLATGRTFSVDFTKRNGERRKMRCQAVDGRVRFSGVDAAPMMRVVDLDLQEIRTLNLLSVIQMGEIKPRASAAAAEVAYLEAKAQMDALFA